MSTTSTPRLDTIAPGSVLRLYLDGDEDNIVFFLGITGEGDKRCAHFSQTCQRGDQRDPDQPRLKTFEWQAYRYQNRWAFGSSADKLAVLEVIR